MSSSRKAFLLCFMTSMAAQHVRAESSACSGQAMSALNNGLKMPSVGLGTWKATGDGEVKAAVMKALKVGYRHIDCAAIYQNEKEVGEALKEALASGLVTREELWITSKLWNARHAEDDVPEALKETLRDLQLDYVDLYLMHWPVTGNEGPDVEPSLKETWLAMEKLVASGLAKTIGVSNFSAKKLKAMKDYASVFPAVNQVELHPLLRQDGLLEASESLGVHTTAYSPLGSPDSASMFNHDGVSLMRHPVVTEVAEALGRTPAQILIRWAVERGTSVVPKSSNPERIAANFDVFDWDLTGTHKARLDAIEPQTRMIRGDFWLKPNGPYKTLTDLWDE